MPSNINTIHGVIVTTNDTIMALLCRIINILKNNYMLYVSVMRLLYMIIYLRKVNKIFLCMINVSLNMG
jgi:hypothetical protein